MDMRVDFHMHSTFSDGIETPEQLLTHAIEQGISYMALTDHDEIDGCRVMKAIKQDQVQIITGCEFSSDFRGKDVHILGYDFDPNNKPLRDFLAYFKEKHPGERCSLDALCERYQIQELEGTGSNLIQSAKMLGSLYITVAPAC